MNKITKKIIIFLVSVLILFSTVISAFAIDWSNLNSGSVSSSSSATSANSGPTYTIPDDDDNVFVGVRCSIVNSSGAKRGQTIDVYFTTKSATNSTKISEHGLDVYDGKVASTGQNIWFFQHMRNKFQCIDALNNVSSTPFSLSNQYVSGDTYATRKVEAYNMGTTNLPNFTGSTDINIPTALEKWRDANNYEVLFAIAKECGISKTEFNTNDVFLMEPLMFLNLGGNRVVCTVSEIGLFTYLYAKEKGSSSPASYIPSSSSSGTSFGYVTNFTNRKFPNYAFSTKDICTGTNKCSAAPETGIASGTWGSANTLVKQGYGVLGIVATADNIVTNPTLTINYYANEGTMVSGETKSPLLTVSFDYSTAINSTLQTYGLADYAGSGSLHMTKDCCTGTGYWLIGSSNSTSKISQNPSSDWDTVAELANKLGVLSDLQSGKSATVDLYAEWKIHQLHINYFTNGGIEVGKTSAVLTAYRTESYTFGNTQDNTNLSTYGLTNYGPTATHIKIYKDYYNATGNWLVGSASSSFKINHDTTFSSVSALLRELDVMNDYSAGDVTVNLYAEWAPNELKVEYYANGGIKNGDTTTTTSKLKTDGYKYNDSGSASNLQQYGLTNYGHGATINISKPNYTATGNWLVGSASSTTKVNHDTKFDSTQSLAETLGVLSSLKTNASTTVKVYAEWSQNSYNVIYNANGGTGTMTNSTAVYGEGFRTKQNAFVRPGYTFNGWREDDGTYWGITDKHSGTYESGKDWIWAYKKDITLYAQWVPNELRIEYYANGGTRTSGTTTSPLTIPSSGLKYVSYIYDENNLNSSLDQYGLADYTSTGSLALTKANYETTGNWLIGSESSSSKIPQTANDSWDTTKELAEKLGVWETLKNQSVTVKLYAEWTPVYTITYNSNGGKWSDNTTSNKTQNYWNPSVLSSPVQKLRGSSDELPTREGYTFVGWTVTSKDSTSTGWPSVNSGYTYSTNWPLTISGNKSGNITFAAKWTPVSYTITFDGNGATSGTMADVTMQFDKVNSTAITNKFTRTGYTFTGWSISGMTNSQHFRGHNTSVSTGFSGTSLAGPSDSTYFKNLRNTPGTVTFTAQWTPITYTIVFNGNDATSGSMSNIPMTYNEFNSSPIVNQFKKDGHSFAGWTISGMTNSTHYRKTETSEIKEFTGTTLTTPSNSTFFKNLRNTSGTVTLTAQWTPNKLTIKYYANGGTFASAAEEQTYSYGDALSSSFQTNGLRDYTSSNGSAYATKDGYQGTGFWIINSSSPTNNTSASLVHQKPATDQSTFSDVTVNAYKTVNAFAERLGVFEALKTGNVTVKLYAQWTRSYTITYKWSDGTSISDLSPITYTTGTGTVTLPAVPTSSSHNSSGWYATQACSGTPVKQFDKNTTGNKIFYAIKTYNVTYNANGGNGAPASQTKKHNIDLILSSTVPTRAGYTFNGWKDETGTSYAKGATYSANAHVTLYAQWKANTLTISFDSNEADAFRTTTKQTYAYNATSSSSSIKNYMTNGFYDYTDESVSYKTGHKATGYWLVNTPTATKKIYQHQYGPDKKQGTLDDYYYTNTIELATALGVLSDLKKGDIGVVLYAQWSPITYEVKYNGNGSTSGSMSNSEHTYNVAKNLTTNAFKRAYTVTYVYNNNTSDTTKTATATFNGWAISANGDKKYNNKQSVTNLASTQDAVVNLYANWTLASVTLPTPTKTGYIFKGWYTASSGGTRVGDGGGSYTPTTNVNLYAQWTPITYTVKYYLDGKEQVSLQQTCTYDVSYKYPSLPLKTGYTVSGWWPEDSSSNNNTQYATGSDFNNLTTTNNEVINRYAYSSVNTYNVYLYPNGGIKTDDVSFTPPNSNVVDWVWEESENRWKATYIYDSGKYVTIPDDNAAFMYKDHYQNGWLKDNTSDFSEKTYNGPSDLHLYAKWLSNSDFLEESATIYTVEHYKYIEDTDSWELIKSVTKQAKINDEVTEYPEPPFGYRCSEAITSTTFTDWSGSQVYKLPKSVKTRVAQDNLTKIVFRYVLDVCTITYDLNEGIYNGSENDYKTTVDRFTTITHISPAREGYVFAGWYLYVDENGGQGYQGTAGEEYTVYEDKTFYALWEKDDNFVDLQIVYNKIYGNIIPNKPFVVSATILNLSDTDITPTNQVGIKLKVSYQDENGDFCEVGSRAESAIVPARNKNLVFLDFEGIDAPVDAELFFDWEIYSLPSSAVDYNKTNNYDSNRSKQVVKVSSYDYKSTTPTPEFALTPNAEYKPTPTSTSINTYSWDVWEYKNGKFEIVSYNSKLPEDTTIAEITLTPENNEGLKETIGNNYITRSGYGFSADIKYTISKDIDFGEMRAALLVPEYSYKISNGIFEDLKTIETYNSDGTITYSSSLYPSDKETTTGIHYTPMWFPDGEYITMLSIGGMWTPIGELQAEICHGNMTQAEQNKYNIKTNKITIEGSLYDDMYIVNDRFDDKDE